jgi:hypothetical protein
MIEEYGRGFDLFAAALAEIPPEAWDFKPAPMEWSVHATIVHMSDSEAIGALRVRKIVAEPGATLMTYDDARWAEALNYQNQSVEDALQVFRLTRQTTYQLLKTLPDQAFSQSAVHPEAVYPEYGESYTLEKWLQVYTRHVRDHIEQLKGNHEVWKAQNR